MRGATGVSVDWLVGATDISIHAPHARSDQAGDNGIFCRCRISIHAPHARSDRLRPRIQFICRISIHAPHARSDAMARRSTGDSSNFNPRSSCEERPVREHRMLRLREISIHAPHARSDRRVDDGVRRITYFNPRSSCEERLQKFKRHCVRTIFQSTLLMRGATAEHQGMLSVHAISIHAPHARSDRGCDLMDLQELQFQSTLLMRGATR